jgi:hypothetical protein
MEIIYATAPADKPAGYAVYALDPVPYGADKYIGWKMVKMKQTPALDDNGKQIIGSDGKPQMLCVDDPDAEVTYDPHTQVLKQVDQQGEQIEQQTKNIESLQTENKSLKSANELTQQGLMEAVDYLSSKLTPASTTTDTGSAATSTAAPASPAASES